jgi:hypothetical protein
VYIAIIKFEGQTPITIYGKDAGFYLSGDSLTDKYYSAKVEINHRNQHGQKVNSHLH